jgi:DNA-nicking Smr family endonuclease
MANQDQDFGSLMEDVIPLRPSGRRWQRPQKQCNRASLYYAKQAATQTIATPFDTNSEPVMVDVEQRLYFQRYMVSAHTVRKLCTGRLRPSFELDLHGRTVKQAYRDILSALVEARREGDRCMLIIHGKGGVSRNLSGVRQGPAQSILKSYVNYWLPLLDQVQAFCSAQQKDGGNGAVYVLLQHFDGEA